MPLSCQEEQELNKGKRDLALEFSTSVHCGKNSPMIAQQQHLIVVSVLWATQKGKRELLKQGPLSPQWGHGIYYPHSTLLCLLPGDQCQTRQSTECSVDRLYLSLSPGLKYSANIIGQESQRILKSASHSSSGVISLGI